MKDLNSFIDKTIVFYDGECGFCDNSVQFILEHERTNEIYFSPLQSAFAVNLFDKEKIENDLSTIIVWHKGVSYKKADAIKIIFSYLKMPYCIAANIMKVLPISFMNYFYDKVAANRMKIKFRHSCRILNQNERFRFIL